MGASSISTDAPVTEAEAGELRPIRYARALLWGPALVLALVVHGAIGLAWLRRPLPALVASGSSAQVFELDLSEAPTDEAASPSEDARTDAAEAPASAPEPAAAEAAEGPAPSPPPVEPPAPLAAPSAPDPDMAAVSARAAEARRRARARERHETARADAEARRAADARSKADIRRRIASVAAPAASAPAGNGGRAAAPPSSSGASAAASAAWRSQIVAILRGRFAGGGSGMASFTFSVTRGGQIAGARLTASSGDPRLDAVAHAVFRGAVPAPPSGYVGALTFNIRLGVR